MAHKAVVTVKAREGIKEMLREVAKEKGDLSLAMLVQTLPEVRERWTLVVSAPWADSSGSRSVISYLSSKLIPKYVDRYALSAIDRISVMQSDDPRVRAILEHFESYHIDVSVKGGFPLRNTIVTTGVGEDWVLGDGYVFVADANANGRSSAQTKAAHIRAEARKA